MLWHLGGEDIDMGSEAVGMGSLLSLSLSCLLSLKNETCGTGHGWEEGWRGGAGKR